MKLSELISAVKDLQAKVTSLLTSKAQASDEQLRKFSSELENIQAQTVPQLQSAEATIASLEAKVKAYGDEMIKLKADLDNAIDKAAKAEASVGMKAAEIAASQGIPAIKEPKTDGGSSEGADLAVELEKITDPTLRTQFFRKHKSALRMSKLAERANPTSKN